MLKSGELETRIYVVNIWNLVGYVTDELCTLYTHIVNIIYDDLLESLRGRFE